MYIHVGSYWYWNNGHCRHKAALIRLIIFVPFVLVPCSLRSQRAVGGELRGESSAAVGSVSPGSLAAPGLLQRTGWTAPSDRLQCHPHPGEGPHGRGGVAPVPGGGLSEPQPPQTQ